jgi:glyoxylase I family protein
MKLEHFALNVGEPGAMAAWYETHLGLRAVYKQEAAPFTHFLADDSGTILLEIYCNPPDQVPGYRSMDPLLLHVAFVTADPDSDKASLVSAGAEAVEDKTLQDGSRVIMLRDPWGLAIQLCKRATPMLRGIDN